MEEDNHSWVWIIVAVAIVAKIMFWVCWAYIRSQNTTTCRSPVIIQGRRRNTDQMVIVQNEHLPAYSHPVDPCASVIRGGYREAPVRKPPAYGKVVQNPLNYSIHPAGSGHNAPSVSTQGGYGPSHENNRHLDK